MVVADADGTLTTQAIPSTGASDWSSLTGIPADFADNTDDVDDADASTTNETITAAMLNGTDLEITEAGTTTTVNLSSLKDADWKKTDGTDATAITDNIYTDGNVGIGTTAVADGSLNVQSNNQEAYGYKSHIVYEDSDGADPLNVVYSSKTVNTASLGTWYNLNVGARISVVNFCFQATTGNDAIAGSFSTSWNTGINHHISVHERIQGGTVTESANVMTVNFGAAGASLGTDLILEVRVNPGNNFIEVQQVGGTYTGDIKMAFHITRFFD